ncbi:E3 ubiquitin- ligase NRDP1 [Paramuricea clavata]|uniref:E3 ubiquitin- ligase NRDP1, partial n=1 Tax=Paramuricea clavata TaxID=317549 RepID=A0A7D9L574_PARCT|nr:E3 ubiquitin- ligase NRDP1 [Paramuricea clavata]
MAAYTQGYDEARFAITVNQNFLCLICFNVLKEPVMCSKNQHCFCRACITKHLKNSQRCPTCADELTVETLAEPQRMVKDYLNELPIHCVHINRGCQEIVQLQNLDRHEATCGFTPAVCTNQGCGATVNKRDLIHHESEQCEFRKLKCHSCGEMAKTLANVEKRVAHLETNMVSIETKMGNLETNIKTDIEEKLGAVNNDVRGLKTALIEGFDQMKDVLVKMEDTIKENTRKVRNAASGDKENIFVAGGFETDSVEIFNWSQKSWAPLHESMPEKRWGATSFLYNNHMMIAGGYCRGPGYVDNMIRMNVDPNPDLSTHWSDCPVKLPMKLAYHSNVLYNNQLMVTGGCIESLDQTSDGIHEVQLVPPYTVKTLSRMPEPRQGHCTEICADNLLIIGGRTTKRSQDCLSSVVLYDIKKNEYKQLAPLPYEVNYMATVRWGDNIVVIGGMDKDGNVLDTVIMYNVKSEQSHMLPPMRCKRWGCTAVVIGNNIVVLGGKDEQRRQLKSVEAFNFESYHWEELPEMSKEGWLHTAVAV